MREKQRRNQIFRPIVREKQRETGTDVRRNRDGERERESFRPIVREKQRLKQREKQRERVLDR